MTINAASVRKQIVSTVEYLGGEKISSVEFDSNAPPHVTKDGKVVLPHPPSTGGKEALTLYRYKIYHEMGHMVAPYHEWGEIFSRCEREKMMVDQRTKWIWNLLEDNAQERNLLGRLDGVDRDLLLGRMIFSQESVPPHPENEVAEKLGAVWHTDIRHRREWNHHMSRVDVTFSPYDRAIKEAYAKLWECKNSEDTFALAQEIFLILFPDEEPMSSPSDGEGEEGGEGEGDKKEKGEDDKGEGDEVKKGSAPSPEEIEEALKKLPASPEESWTPKIKGWGPVVLQPVILYDFGRKKVKFVGGTPKGEMAYSPENIFSNVHASLFSAVMDHRGQIRSLASEARRLLLSRAQIRKSHGHKAGKLAASSLWKVPQGGERIFSKKEEALSLNTAVSLLVDYSASMCGRGEADKRVLAIASAGALYDSIKPLGVNVEVAGFSEGNEYGGAVAHFLFGKFGEHVKSDTLMERMCMRHGYEQNSDGESVDIAASRLMEQSNARKILIVLSDGSPCAHTKGNLRAHLSHVVSEWEKHIEIYAVGILDNSVEHFYTNHMVVDTISDLMPRLTGIVKTIFK